MDKCYNNKCDKYSTKSANKCDKWRTFLKSVCKEYISHEMFIMNELQAELKLYKKAYDRACQILKVVIVFCPKKTEDNQRYVAVSEDECNAVCGKMNLLKCYKEHFLTKAKEGTNEKIL